MILFFRFLKNRCFCHDRMCSPVRGLMWGEDFYQKTAIKREQKENSFSLCRAWAGSTKSNCFHVKIFDLHHKVLKALTSCYGVFIVFVKISPARMLNTGNSEWAEIFQISVSSFKILSPLCFESVASRPITSFKLILYQESSAATWNLTPETNPCYSCYSCYS